MCTTSFKFLSITWQIYLIKKNVEHNMLKK
jgi:hypothetical protein